MDIEVIVHSMLPVDEKQGKFSVFVSESITVVGLIRKICLENGIPMKSTYLLKTQHSQTLRWSATLQESLTSGQKHFYLYDTAEESIQTKRFGCNIWWFIGGISLLIGTTGLVAITVMWSKRTTVEYEYGIVMDAGSSHTSLYIYRWNGEKLNNTALASQFDYCKVPGSGISSYENDPKNVSSGLRRCLNQAVASVPSDKHATTPVFLGATAGMRLLHEVNRSRSDAILAVVRDTVKEFPFKITNPEKQVRIISGDEEGMYSWVTTNYVAKSFGVKPPTMLKRGGQWMLSSIGQGTVGALDLGGASTQNTFYPGPGVSLPKDYSGHLTLYGLNYSVYTQSYLCYGINEITRKYRALLVKSNNYNLTVENPCGPKDNSTLHTHADVFEAPCTKDQRFTSEVGVANNTTYTLVGTSDNEACHTTVQQLFNFNDTCPFGEDNCSFNGTYQPPVYGKFYAFSNFFYQMEFMNFTKNSSSVPLQLYADSLKSLCSKNWNQVKNMKTVNTTFLPEYCFRGHYILTLLNEGYKFDNNAWGNIKFVDKLNGIEIGWSLGFMIAASDNIASVTPKSDLTLEAFIPLLVLFGAFILIAVGFACHGVRHHRLKSGHDYESVANYGSI